MLVLAVEFFSKLVPLQLHKIRGIRSVHHVQVYYSVYIVCIRVAVGKYTARDDTNIYISVLFRGKGKRWDGVDFSEA